MKFYGNGVVWDKDNSKRLCKFIDGVYSTEDKREIEIIKQIGFKHDNETSYADMRTYCKEHDYKDYYRLNKEDLIKFIAESEGKI